MVRAEPMAATTVHTMNDTAPSAGAARIAARAHHAALIPLTSCTGTIVQCADVERANRLIRDRHERTRIRLHVPSEVVPVCIGVLRIRKHAPNAAYNVRSLRSLRVFARMRERCSDRSRNIGVCGSERFSIVDSLMRETRLGHLRGGISMVSSVLHLSGVCRSFGRGAARHEVVHEVSLDVPAGSVVCLLGPNGAGKTTTVRMASTLLAPDSGRIEVCGVDAVREPRRARANLSLLLGGERGFYLRVSAVDNLRFFAQLAGVPRAGLETRIAEALERVSLTGHARERVETFSRGMRQRLHIARALVSRARLVLLDEPTTGLDPESALEVRTLVADMRADGAGVLLTTHAMPEAEALADRIHVIDGGRIIASGDVHDLAGMVRIDGVTSYTAPSGLFGVDGPTGLDVLPGVRGVDAVLRNGVWSVDIAWCGREPDLKGLPSGMRRMGVRGPTLEETYLAILRERRVGRENGGGLGLEASAAGEREPGNA